MTASLGGSVLVIVMFFSALCTMLTLAVHMESTLQRPRARWRVGVPAHEEHPPAEASEPPGSTRARSRM